jgi:hypothetical protein
MEKKGANWLQNYAKNVSKMIDQLTPWRKKSSRRGEHLRGKVTPGEVVVLLDGSERATDPLYTGAKIARE